MRYFFHVVEGGSTIRDPKGADYADLASARHGAAILARELVRQEGWPSFTIVVATRNEPVLRILVAAKQARNGGAHHCEATD